MNALTVIEAPQQRNVELFRQSTNAASLCKDIVVKRAIDLQGKRYVPVEGWQAIALAHGCVVSAENVRHVDGGIAADGVIRRMSDGGEIARAEGFVGEDEPTWYGGKNKWGKTLEKRPEFAIRAMAQTRAMSRACRTAFAHVVVMMDVGLETTPAEEMQGVYDMQPRQPSAAEQPMRNATPAPRQAKQPERPAPTPFDNPAAAMAEEAAGHVPHGEPAEVAAAGSEAALFDVPDYVEQAASLDARYRACSDMDSLRQLWADTASDTRPA